jgi:hypothetical protein
MHGQGRLRLLAAAVLAVGLGASGAATAAPLDIYNSMRETPITKYEKADVDLMTKTIYRTLDSGEDGVTVKWENPGTPNSGTVTPAKDPQGRPGCRLAQIENHHKAMHASGGYIFCKSKTKGKSWDLVGKWAG